MRDGKERRRKGEVEGRITKSKFSCLFFSASVWVTITLGEFSTIE